MLVPQHRQTFGSSTGASYSEPSHHTLIFLNWVKSFKTVFSKHCSRLVAYKLWGTWDQYLRVKNFSKTEKLLCLRSSQRQHLLLVAEPGFSRFRTSHRNSLNESKWKLQQEILDFVLQFFAVAVAAVIEPKRLDAGHSGVLCSASKSDLSFAPVTALDSGGRPPTKRLRPESASTSFQVCLFESGPLWPMANRLLVQSRFGLDR